MLKGEFPNEEVDLVIFLNSSKFRLRNCIVVMPRFGTDTEEASADMAERMREVGGGERAERRSGRGVTTMRTVEDS